MGTKLRWGILGTGNIATQFARGLATCKRGTAAAVGLCRRGSAEGFAQSHNIARAFGSYESLIADGEIDAVYNSLPNSLHGNWTIAALKAGKHVYVREAAGDALGRGRAEMFDAGEAGGPGVDGGVHVSVASADTGPERDHGAGASESSSDPHRFYIHAKIEGNVRFTSHLAASGADGHRMLLHQFRAIFAGDEPGEIHATANFHSSGVDELAAGTLVFPNQIVSSFTCGMCASGGQHRVSLRRGGLHRSARALEADGGQFKNHHHRRD